MRNLLLFNAAWLGLLLAGCVSRPTGNPDEIVLFNGRDLTGWTPKIRGYPLGENYGNTFRVRDSLLTVDYSAYDSFRTRYGHLFYEVPFSHYRLALEYRFVGAQVAGGEGWATRNSGVMIHSQSPATMGVDQDFPISIEVQFLGGLGAGPRPTANLCTPGTHVTMADTLVTDHCISSTSRTFDGNAWVHVAVVVQGDSLITHLVEGDTVLQYTRPVVGGGVVNGFYPSEKKDGTRLTGGYIALQSESHPIQFRSIRLTKLK